MSSYKENTKKKLSSLSKYKYIKNHTNFIWGGGTPQNLYLAFIDELEKQLFIYKTVEVGQ